MRTFKEILRDITSACNDIMYSGYRNNYKEVIECATKIYIAEMHRDKEK